MAKRKITVQQQRRVQRKQQKETALDHLGTQQIGLVIAHYGTKVDLESTDGRILSCRLRQHLGGIACGDRVVWQPDQQTTGVVTAILPRQSLLARFDPKNPPRPVAANIDQVLIVTAPLPMPTPSLLDSYLVAVETLQLRPIILCNKVDLIDKTDADPFRQWLTQYEKIGYPVYYTSIQTQNGLVALQTALRNGLSVLVGQSGVGKSSLIAQLVPTVSVARGDISETTQHGKHTTSTARLYHLPSGGSLIDSPGVRDFGLWTMAPAQIAYGFVEFRPYLSQCRFNDCRHRHEPGCALQHAVDIDAITAERFESYHALVAKYATT